jgi:hypothetical protein
VLAALSRRRSRVQVPSGPQVSSRPGSSVGTSVRLKIGRSAVRPRPWPPGLSPGSEHRPPAETHGGRFAIRTPSHGFADAVADLCSPVFASACRTQIARKISLPRCHPVRRRPTHRGAGLPQGAKVERPTGRTTLAPRGRSARLCLGCRWSGWQPPSQKPERFRRRLGLCRTSCTLVRGWPAAGWGGAPLGWRARSPAGPRAAVCAAP